MRFKVSIVAPLAWSSVVKAPFKFGFPQGSRQVRSDNILHDLRHSEHLLEAGPSLHLPANNSIIVETSLRWEKLLFSRLPLSRPSNTKSNILLEQPFPLVVIHADAPSLFAGTRLAINSWVCGVGFELDGLGRAKLCAPSITDSEVPRTGLLKL